MLGMLVYMGWCAWVTLSPKLTQSSDNILYLYHNLKLVFPKTLDDVNEHKPYGKEEDLKLLSQHMTH